MRIITKVARLLAPLLLAVSIGAAVAPSNASAADYWCASTNVSANDGFREYVPVEGFGLVGWRTYMNLQVRDRCDHGSLGGTVGVYDGNLRYGGRGNVGVQISYHNGVSWTGRGIRLLPVYRVGDWQYYNVYTDGHIDLSRNTRMAVKVTTWPIAGNVPQGLSAHSSICYTATRTCTTKRGF
jgi:hypothetical protein